MSDGPPKVTVIKPRTADERAAREARLAEEMRANLRKRKAQKRALGPEAGREFGEDHGTR